MLCVFEKCPRSYKGEGFLLKGNFSGDFVLLWISHDSAALCRLPKKTQHELDWMEKQAVARRKLWYLFLQGEMCLTVSLKSIESFIFFVSDWFSRSSFADEDFQQPQFGFDVFVFIVLDCQRGAVLLLRDSMGTRQQTLRIGEGSAVENQLNVNVDSLAYVFFSLPSVLPKKLVFKLFQVLAESFLLLPALLELHHEFFPVRVEIFFIFCSTIFICVKWFIM